MRTSGEEKQMKDSKTMFRLFTIADFEQEAQFLSKQHKNGWKYVSYTFPGFYHFTACEPADYVYQLDFSDRKEADLSAYLQMFMDDGWEYLGENVGYSYFRKPVEAQTPIPAIYSDMESKLAHVSRIMKTRMLPILALFFGLILFQLHRMLDGIRLDGITAVSMLLLLLFLYYIYMVIRCAVGLARLKREYLRGKR